MLFDEGAIAMSPSVISQPTNDKDILVYHLRFEATSVAEAAARGAYEGDNDLMMMLLALPGVAAINLTPYMIIVTKAALFSWEEIAPPLEEILKIFHASQVQLAAACNEIIKFRN